MISIILPISRKTHLQKIFALLDMMDCPPDTNLLCYADTDMDTFQIARNFTIHSKFKERLCIYRNKGIPGTGSIRMRRQRISDIHNEIKELIKNSEYLFLIEDDTVFPLNAITKLQKTFSSHQYAGIISGVQLGRHGWTHIGAWQANDVYEPTKIWSVENSEGIKPVDATGLYCCMIRTENYKLHNFEPFQDILGPDVNLGFWLRQQGFQNYVDYSLRCGHLTPKEEINFANSQVQQVEFEKQGNDWAQGLKVI